MTLLTNWKQAAAITAKYANECNEISIWGAAIFTTSKNTDAVFLATRVKRWMCQVLIWHKTVNMTVGTR